MRTAIIFLTFAVCLAFSGCSKEESQPASSKTSEPVQQPAETTQVIKQAEQVVEQAQEKIAKVAEQSKEKVAEVTEQAKDKAAEVTEQAKEKMAVVTKQTEEKVTQVKVGAQSLLGAVSGNLAAVSSSTISGEDIYSKSCSSCHRSGIIGAPKTGDKTAWAPLINGGIDKLEQNSIKGLGKMPAKGGNSKLTDAEVKAAVGYMVEQGQ